MIWYAICATAVAGAAIWATIRQARKTRKWIKKYREAEAEIERREHIITSMQEVARETAKKKKELRSGSDRDRFAAANDILSNGPGGAPRSRDHD